MKKLFLPLLLVFFVCSAVVLSARFFSAPLPPAAPETGAPPQLETVGTQLLWESLAHQFLTNVPR